MKKQKVDTHPYDMVGSKVYGHEDGLDLVDSLEEKGLLASEARGGENGDEGLEGAHDSKDLSSSSDRSLYLLDVTRLARR